MTTYTPRSHGEYLEFFTKCERDFSGKHAEAELCENQEDMKLWEIAIEQNFANRDTLERRKEKFIPAQFFPEQPARIVCSFCESWQFGRLSVPFPCPAYTDITKHLDGVMG